MGASCSKGADKAVPTKSSQPLELSQQNAVADKEDRSAEDITLRTAAPAAPAVPAARSLGGSAVAVPSSISQGDLANFLDNLVRRNRAYINLNLTNATSEDPLFILIHHGATKCAALELLNSTDDWLGFKMKTTHPDTYKVKPVHGVIPPREKREVLIFLDARKRKLLVEDHTKQKPGKLQICQCGLTEAQAQNGELSMEDAAALWAQLDKEAMRYVKVPAKFFVAKDDAAAGGIASASSMMLDSGVGMATAHSYGGGSISRGGSVRAGEEFTIPITGATTPESALRVVVDARAQTVQGVARLYNDSPHAVAFKVKTTNPKMYLVKPSHGTLEPTESLIVDVSVQSSWMNMLVENANLPEGGKFLIQSLTIDMPTFREIRAASKDVATQRLSEVWQSSADTAVTGQHQVAASYLAKFPAAFVSSGGGGSVPVPRGTPHVPEGRQGASSMPEEIQAVALHAAFENGRDGQLETHDAPLIVKIQDKGLSGAMIVLENRRDSYCIFKTKTTDPDMYLVKPSIDIVKPGETCNIRIVVVDSYVALVSGGIKSNAGKFLVQNAAVTEADVRGIEAEAEAGGGDRATVVELMSSLWAGLPGESVHALKIQADFSGRSESN